MLRLKTLFTTMLCVTLAGMSVQAETDEEARVRLQNEIAVCKEKKEIQKSSESKSTDNGIHSIAKVDEYPEIGVEVQYNEMTALFGYGVDQQQEAEMETANRMNRYAQWGVLYDNSTILSQYGTSSYFSGYNNNSIVSCSEDELMYLRYVVAAEAGNQGLIGMQMVAEVVINRVLDNRFPNTIEEVIFAPWQFTPTMNGSFYTAYNNLSDSARNDCDIAVANALSGSNLTNDAIYFRTKHYHEGTMPTTQFGAHYFSK